MTPQHRDDPPWMHDLTDPQRAFFRMLTDQRIANLVAAADLLGDMDADTYQLLKSLSEDDQREMRQFLWRCKPEVLRFLYDLRKEELDELKGSIETYLAFKHTGRVLRWGIAVLFAAFIGMTMLWDKLLGMAKPPLK